MREKARGGERGNEREITYETTRERREMQHVASNQGRVRERGRGGGVGERQERDRES